MEIGVFEALAHGGKSLEELRTELKMSVRAANALIATLCGLKLLSAFHHFGSSPIVPLTRLAQRTAWRSSSSLTPPASSS